MGGLLQAFTTTILMATFNRDSFARVETSASAHLALQQQASTKRPNPVGPDMDRTWESVLAIHDAIASLEVQACHVSDPLNRADLSQAIATIGVGLRATWDAFRVEGQ